MSDHVDAVNTFHIALDAEILPGRIAAIRVTLKQVIIGDKENVCVSLKGHPLYPDLRRYCLANVPQMPESTPARRTSLMVPLHPAYAVVENVVSAWAVNKEQKWAQVEQIVGALARAGILTDGEWRQGRFAKLIPTSIDNAGTA